MKSTQIEHPRRWTLVSTVLALGLVSPRAGLAEGPESASRAPPVVPGMSAELADDTTSLLPDFDHTDGASNVIPGVDLALFGFLPSRAACSGFDEPGENDRVEAASVDVHAGSVPSAP